jgi:hypothetical protein
LDRFPSNGGYRFGVIQDRLRQPGGCRPNAVAALCGPGCEVVVIVVHAHEP